MAKTELTVKIDGSNMMGIIKKVLNAILDKTDIYRNRPPLEYEHSKGWTDGYVTGRAEIIDLIDKMVESLENEEKEVKKHRPGDGSHL